MTDDRGAQPDTGPDPYDEPVDPDIALISDWLARELSEEDGAAVAKRLREDAVFFEKVWPIVRIWRMRRSYRRLVAEHAEAAKTAQAGWEYPWVDTPARAPSEDAPDRKKISEQLPPEYSPPKRERTVERTPWDRERLRDRAGWEPAGSSGWEPAGGAGGVALAPRGLLALIPTSPAVQATWLGMATVVLVMAGYFMYRIGQISGSRDRFPALVERKAQADARVAKLNPLAVPVIVRAGESTYVLGRVGSKVVKAVSLDTGEVTAVLEGEAYFEIHKEFGKAVVNVGMVIIDLTPGTYAIRCETGSDDVLITVGQGTATIREPITKASLTLVAGEHGRAHGRQPAERTRGGEGYPALEPPRAIAR